ncbi:MAG: hypothetical protein QM586_11695 [Xenophilus sp.]
MMPIDDAQGQTLREELRLAALMRQAPLEFARAVYGINDRTAGRVDTMAAQDVLRVERQGALVTRERAEQRARAYLPVAGHEHCPRCWVLGGFKHLLNFRRGSDGALETGKCRNCGAEYASSVG